MSLEPKIHQRMREAMAHIEKRAANPEEPMDAALAIGLLLLDIRRLADGAFERAEQARHNSAVLLKLLADTNAEVREALEKHEATRRRLNK